MDTVSWVQKGDEVLIGHPKASEVDLLTARRGRVDFQGTAEEDLAPFPKMPFELGIRGGSKLVVVYLDIEGCCTLDFAGRQVFVVQRQDEKKSVARLVPGCSQVAS